MTSDRDIWATAKQCVDTYGDAAAFHAAMRADELLERGDLEGAKVWRRVLTAVEHLQAGQPPEGTSSH